MITPQSFRSAFNGFNREDVVHYIEYINANHTAKVNQLKDEIAALNTRLESVQADSGADARCADLAAQLALANETIAALRAELQARPQAEAVENPLNIQLAERCESLERQLQAANAASQSTIQQELEAYRRAERLERLARERSEQVYRLANGALADATVKVDEASAQLGDLTDRVSAQLLQLQNAVTGSKQALADAAATLYAIRPENQE